MMIDYRKNEFVQTKNFKKVDGWGVLECNVSDLFSVWLVERYSFIAERHTYDFGEFEDYVNFLPVYFFATETEAVEFAHRKDNRLSIERSIYWLRFQDWYWFSTIAIAKLDWLRYRHSLEHMTNLYGRIDTRRVVHRQPTEVK